MMASLVLRFLNFFIFVFLSYLVPIALFGYGSWIFAGQGEYIWAFAFFLAAVGFLALLLSRKSSLGPRKIEWLKVHGQKLMAEFKLLDRRWNTAVNGQSSFVIYAEGSGRVFESDDLWFGDGDASFVIKDASYRAWETLRTPDPSRKYWIPVYINPARPGEYFMDLEALEVE